MICVIVVLLSSSSLLADNVLESWGDGISGTDFLWDAPTRTITIVHGNSLNYKFWVHDGSGVPATISIYDIDVDDNATGDFTIEIRHPDGRPGALHLEGADVSYPGGTSTVVGMYLASNFAFENRTVVLEEVNGLISVPDAVMGSLRILGTLSGAFDVGGDILETGANTIEIGDIAPTGVLECENLVHGEIERTSPGQFVRIGPGDGLIEGTIRVNQTLGESIHFRSACASTVEIWRIDSPAQPDPNMPYWGLHFTGGTTTDCNIAVEDRFKQGVILAEKAAPAQGDIVIAGSSVGCGLPHHLLFPSRPNKHLD
jgi:hypothetical protein